MTSRSASGAAAGEEAQMMRQLEVLLVPLHHRFRYPLPTPAHLADNSSAESRYETNAFSATTAGDDTESSSAAEELWPELTEEAYFDRLRGGVLAAVENAVPDLRQWQTRVQSGAARAGECHELLDHVRNSISAMQHVTASVQEQSDHLSHNASAMMVRKAKLELVRDALEQNLTHFTHIDDLCREAGNPFLKAGTLRFSTLLQDIASEMEFLSSNTQYKSAKPYAMRLAVAQQMVNAILKDAVRQSFSTMEERTRTSPAFAAATHVFEESSAVAVVSSGARKLTEGPAADAAPTMALALTLPHPADDALHLRRDDVAGSFAEFLATVNDAFVRAGESSTSLRRMAELRQGGFSYAGAEAFGEEMLTMSEGLEADEGMTEVLDAYREARVGVVVPLLRYWLTLWYYLDTQESAAVAMSNAPAQTDQQQQLTGVAGAHTLPQLAEHICGLLQRSMAAEAEVLGRIWLREDITSSLLPKLVFSIAEEVYYTFRSRLLCVDDVGELARTVESIQRVSLREGEVAQDSEVVSDLWLRMIQDTQERLVFRTSVYLRQSVARCTPTREMAAVFLRCGTGTYMEAAAAAASTGDDGALVVASAETKMFYIPGVVNALQLLHWLYSTLEFSIFSVFAEEAVRHSIELIRQLVKLMRQLDGADELRETKALLCQLAHLQHVEVRLSHVDASIKVVERHLNFARLRERRLELEQSSKDSKKEVQMELLKCSEHLATAILAHVTQPMAGAARKLEAERGVLVAEMKGRALGMGRMIAFYVEHAETRQDLLHLLQERQAELAAEVGVDLQSVPAVAPVVPEPRPVQVMARVSGTPNSSSTSPLSHPSLDAATAAAHSASVTAPEPEMATATTQPASSFNVLPPPPSASQQDAPHMPDEVYAPALTSSDVPPVAQPLPPPPPAAAPVTRSAEQERWLQQHQAHMASAYNTDTELI